MPERRNIFVNVTAALHEALKKLATAENRSLSNYVGRLLEQHISKVKRK